MAKLLIDWSDGHYSTRPLDAQQVRNLEASDPNYATHNIVHVEDSVYRAWLAHCDQSAVFDAMWRALTSIHDERNRGAHEYTCIYPQPGCKLQALDSFNTDWRILAERIVATYRQDSSKYQGCCCEHSHKKLNDADVAKLREAGFVVEHDVEYDR